MRLLSLNLLVVLAASACAGRLDVELPADSDATRAPHSTIPGDPVVRELDTEGAHVIRLSEAAVPETVGRLHLSSPSPGVAASVDGGDPLSLPHNLDLPPGAHHVVASCPDGTTETYRATVEGGATVHLRLCGRPMRP